MKLGRIILSAVLAAGCLFSAAGCSGAPKSSVGNVEELNFVTGDKLAEITIEGYGTIKAKLFPDLAPNGVENFIKLAEQGYYDGLKIHRVLPDAMIQGGSLNGDGTGGKALINDDGSFDIETSEKARNFYGALCYANDLGKNTTQFYIVNNKKSQDITKYDIEKIQATAAEYTAKKEALTANTPDHNACTFKESYYTNLAAMLTSADEKVTAKYSETGGYPMFDGGYTVFGQVYEGFDVIDAISSSEVVNNSVGEKSKPLVDIIITSVKIIDYVAPEETEEGDKDSKDDKKDESSTTESESESSDTESGSESPETSEETSDEADTDSSADATEA